MEFGLGPKELVESTKRIRIMYFVVFIFLAALIVGYQSYYFSTVDAELEKILKNIYSLAAPQPWREPTLLNLKSFKWIMNNADICKLNNSANEVRIMPILVHSRRQHFQERLALRKSIGSFPPHKNWTIRLVFLLGETDQPPSPLVNLQQLGLRGEQLKYGDIVMGSFTDSYRNLTYKHLMGYKWILNFCPGATFVLKMDDDIFVDVFRWVDWRTADLLKKKKKKPIPDLYCQRMGGMTVIRDNASKWYVTRDEWPSDRYPNYCSGWAYGITVELVQKLYSASKGVKYFWVDDVYATGALMEAAKLKPKVKHITNFEFSFDMSKYRSSCQNGLFSAKREIPVVGSLSRGKLYERDLMCLWNKTLHVRNYL